MRIAEWLGDYVQYTSWILIACGLIFLAWAFARWKRTLAWHSDYGARRDTALLLLLVVLGLVGDRIRMLFVERSTGFLVTSLALIPIAIAALVVLVRLIGAYWKSGQAAPSTSSAPAARRGPRE